LEGNFYLEKDALVKRSSAPVENNIRIGKGHGLAPATPDEAREIHGLKGLDGVKF